MKTIQDVKNFFAELDERFACDWHPDRNFLEDSRITVKDALDLNDRMRDAFLVAHYYNLNLYDIHERHWRKRRA